MNEAVDSWVEKSIVKTHGNLYRGRTLPRYPVPAFPLGPGDGRTLLDVGCNWGRWTIAAARAGYLATGVDPKVKAIAAARRVADQLGVSAEFAVGDARRLPFPDGSFDVVFSYSVLQHLSKEDTRTAVAEIGRVLRPGGTALVEMPNARGLLNLARQAGRRFSEGSGFDVRYWTLAELRDVFGVIGDVELLADGFLTLNPQPADLDLLRRRHRPLVRMSEVLRRASLSAPFLVRLADSVNVRVVADR